MWKKVLIHIILLLLITPLVKAQVSHGGKPLPINTLRSTPNALFVNMPAFDAEAELRIDSLDQSSLRSSYRFAYKFITDYNPHNSGTSFTLADGTRVWRLGIRSAGAFSINVLFTAYELPEGASLYLYNADQSKVLGAFNHLNNSELGKLPVSPVPGDELIIEYQEPANAAFHAKLTVGEVNHAYRDFRGAGPVDNNNLYRCMAPLSCNEDRFGEIGRSVVLMVIDGMYLCTGTLVNNTSGDGKPYLLTASHCLNKQFTVVNPDYEEVAGKIICFFNYNSPLCNEVMRGTEEMSVSSARFRAVDEKTDMALLELVEIPPVHYQPYYAGWNIQDKGMAPYAGIHHPGGSVKRVNTLNGTTYLTSYASELFDPDVHWKIDRWTTGSTHAGSSGSPLFDSKDHIIGALSGGESSCIRPNNDFYYAIGKSWNASAKPDRQLKYWLNPENDKEKQTCDGTDPYASTPCIRLSNVTESGQKEKIEATLLSTGSNQYLFGINHTGATEYAEAYKINGKTLLHGVYLINPAIENSNIQVEVRIYSGRNGPETLIHTERFSPTYMKPGRNKESFLSFPTLPEVDGTFYVSYKIITAGDSSFEVFNLPKGATTRNTAWIRYPDKWIEATAHPVLPFPTALYIDPVIRYETTTSNEPAVTEQQVRIFIGQDRKSVSILLPDYVQQGIFSIVTLDGKTIWEKTVSGPQITLPVEITQPGVYLTRIIYKNKHYTQKVVF